MNRRTLALIALLSLVSAGDTRADPYADEVVSFIQLDADDDGEPDGGGGFNENALEIVLGAPVGGGLFQGSLDVVSLGREGIIVLRFVDNVIVDGPGVDFTVFENAFLTVEAGPTSGPPFAEPGRVSVSQDGVVWHVFSACSLTVEAGPYWPGCAGVYPVISDDSGNTALPWIPTAVPIEDLVGLPLLSITLPPGSGGDSFDLADVGLTWASYVRIEAADFDPGPVGSNNAGFDLDAVVAIHSAWVQKVPALSGPGLVLLCAMLCVAARTSLGTQR